MSRFFLLSLVVSTCAYPGGFDRFDDLVHIIKIKTKGRSADQSSGTGFVVNKLGLLVTNYHVISGVFTKGKIDPELQIFVKIGAKEFQAEVVNVDILSDLALLRVPQVFTQQVRIRQRPLSKGEKIYSLGFHDKEFLSINQGIFNGYIKETENELMAITCPLNPGMSGGPMIDGNFDVVGVNVLKNSGKESDGYGINARKLIEFLDVNREFTSLSLEQLVTFQMGKTYQKIMAALESDTDSQKLNAWAVPDLEHFMVCGEFKEEHNPNRDMDDWDKNQIIVTKRICVLDARKVPLSVLGSQMSLYYEVGNVRGSENTRASTYYKFINDQFKFQGYQALASGDEYGCRRDVVKNDLGQKFKLSICAFRQRTIPDFVKEKEHFQFEIKATSLSREMDTVILHAGFSGTRGLAKRVIKKLINRINREKGKGA